VHRYQAKRNFFGGIWPVVQRELRVGARRPFNYWVRVGAAAAGTLVLWYIVGNMEEPPATIGSWLFACLHALLLWLICLFVPGMTADCISREKREGTLGLLFLTPLNARGIVLGKGIVQALRAFTLWLAVLPVLTIPLLLGGVGRTDVFRAIAGEFCATMLCLAAGLLASSLVKSRGAAFVLALLCAVGFIFVLGLFLWNCILWQLRSLLGGYHLFAGPYDWMVFMGLIPMPAPLYTGGSYLTAVPIPSGFWLWSLSVCILLALLLSFLVVWFAARRIERSWQDKPPSPEQEYLVKRYCTPLFQRLYSRLRRHSLDRNPIAWLQQYSWKARLVKWGLCLAFIVVESMALRGNPHNFETVQTMLLLILAGAYTFVGVNSFLAEKRSGALELILITPISVNKIIFGRVWGLWKQFLPAALILAFCDNAAPVRPYDYFLPRFMIACGFFALPFCATCFALRFKNLIVAAVLTWIALLLPPFIAGASNGIEPDGSAGLFCFLLLYANLVLVLLVTFRLRHSLSRRIYSF
jgi:ABC-type transport system involved in multi-copper enzyme maturation permease subunit